MGLEKKNMNETWLLFSIPFRTPSIKCEAKNDRMTHPKNYEKETLDSSRWVAQEDFSLFTRATRQWPDTKPGEKWKDRYQTRLVAQFEEWKNRCESSNLTPQEGGGEMDFLRIRKRQTTRSNSIQFDTRQQENSSVSFDTSDSENVHEFRSERRTQHTELMYITWLSISKKICIQHASYYFAIVIFVVPPYINVRKYIEYQYSQNVRRKKTL